MPPTQAPVIKKIQATINSRVTKNAPKTPQKNSGPQQTGSSSKFATPKHGWCPKCDFGHRVLGRNHPEGGGVDAGRKRYVCSNAGDDGCDYYELADETAPAAPVIPSKGGVCPQCKKGRLLEKLDNPFNYRERYLECDRKFAPERPCSYREDVSRSRTSPGRTVAPPSLIQTPTEPVGTPQSHPITPQGQLISHQREPGTHQQHAPAHQRQMITPQKEVVTSQAKPVASLATPATHPAGPITRPGQPLTPNSQFSNARQPAQPAEHAGPSAPSPRVVTLGYNPFSSTATRTLLGRPHNPQNPRSNLTKWADPQPNHGLARVNREVASPQAPGTTRPMRITAPHQPNIQRPPQNATPATGTVIDLTQLSDSPPSQVNAGPPTAPRGRLPARNPVRAASPNYGAGLDDNDMLDLAIQTESQLMKRRPLVTKEDEYGFNSDDEGAFVQLVDRVSAAALQTPARTPGPAPGEGQGQFTPTTPTRRPVGFTPRQFQKAPAFGPRRGTGH